MKQKFFLPLSLVIGLLFVPLTSVQAANNAAVDLTTNIQATAAIVCYSDLPGGEADLAVGSGVFIGQSTILTNAHVIINSTGNMHDNCVGGTSETALAEPEVNFALDLTEAAGKLDENFDYAFVETVQVTEDLHPKIGDYVHPVTVEFGNADSLTLGDEMTAIGFPAVGEATPTTTTGEVVGYIGNTWIKVDTQISLGNSGGGVYDVFGNLVGIATAVSSDIGGSIGYVQNLNAILEDYLGTEYIIRDYERLYQTDNVVSIPSEGLLINVSESDDILELEDTDTPNPEEVNEAPTEETPEIVPPISVPIAEDTSIDNGSYDPEKHDPSLVERLKGSILLQVERNGEAWYINPDDGQRYYMRDGQTAYQMMRSFGLGITNADLEKIPIGIEERAITIDTDGDGLEDQLEESIGTDPNNPDTDNDTYNDGMEVKTGYNPLGSGKMEFTNLAESLEGKILLQVESSGEAWYVHEGKRYYMKDGEAAYAIMRYLGLGITDADLQRIPTSSI